MLGRSILNPQPVDAQDAQDAQDARTRPDSGEMLRCYRPKCPRSSGRAWNVRHRRDRGELDRKIGGGWVRCSARTFPTSTRADANVFAKKYVLLWYFKRSKEKPMKFGPHRGLAQVASGSAPRQPGIAPACDSCGAPLLAPRSTGRPRLTCSTACRRARDARTRRIRRRREWIVNWQAAIGQYPRQFIRRVVRQFREEIRRDLQRPHNTVWQRRDARQHSAA